MLCVKYLYAEVHMYVMLCMILSLQVQKQVTETLYGKVKIMLL